MSVYIVRALGTDFYKIGYTSKDPATRLRSLQTGCPHELRLVAWFEGDRSDEEYLHRLFDAHRVRGEWFQLPHEPIGYIHSGWRSMNPAHFSSPEAYEKAALDSIDCMTMVTQGRRWHIARNLWSVGLAESAARVYADATMVDALLNRLTTEDHGQEVVEWSQRRLRRSQELERRVYGK